MRVMCASTANVGHFGPMVPFIDAFIRSGCDVRLVTPPGLDCGAVPVVRAPATDPEVLGSIMRVLHQLAPGQGEPVVVGTVFARLGAASMLPTLRAVADDWRPDLVVRETAEFGSAILADERSLPQISVSTGLHTTEEFALGLATWALEEQRAGLAGRLARVPAVSGFPASVDPAPPRVTRFRGAPTEARPLPDWWQGDDRPLVYLTMGTVAASVGFAYEPLRAALNALTALPVRVLVTTGAKAAPELGSLPTSVHVEPWVAQAEVLAQAVLAVHHGGAGTTLGCLTAGVPSVVVPLFADQPTNAARVALHGAGVSSSVLEIRAAIERVLGEPAYRRRAGQLADEIAALRPADDVLALADSLTR